MFGYSQNPKHDVVKFASILIRMKGDNIAEMMILSAQERCILHLEINRIVI